MTSLLVIQALPMTSLSLHDDEAAGDVLCNKDTSWSGDCCGGGGGETWSEMAAGSATTDEGLSGGGGDAGARQELRWSLMTKDSRVIHVNGGVVS